MVRVGLIEWMLFSSSLIGGDDHRFARLDPCDQSVCTIRELMAGEWAYD